MLLCEGCQGAGRIRRGHAGCAARARGGELGGGRVRASASLPLPARPCPPHLGTTPRAAAAARRPSRAAPQTRARPPAAGAGRRVSRGSSGGPMSPLPSPAVPLAAPRPPPQPRPALRPVPWRRPCEATSARCRQGRGRRGAGRHESPEPMGDRLPPPPHSPELWPRVGDRDAAAAARACELHAHVPVRAA